MFNPIFSLIQLSDTTNILVATAALSHQRHVTLSEWTINGNKQIGAMKSSLCRFKISKKSSFVSLELLTICASHIHFIDLKAVYRPLWPVTQPKHTKPLEFLKVLVGKDGKWLDRPLEALVTSV